MTDNEQLDDTKQMSDYAKQRAKHKEELDAKDQKIAELESQLKANKVAYFKDTLSKQGYKGDFDEFANKYADTLDVNEMLSLYAGMNGVAPVQAVQEAQVPEAPAEQQQQTIGPKSIIGANPIGGDQPKSLNDLSVEEMKARGRAHPELLQN